MRAATARSAKGGASPSTLRGPPTSKRLFAYRWTFSDGATADSVTTSKTYTQDGIYPVALDVTDIAGSVASDTIDVSVANLPPIVAPIADLAAHEGDMVTVQTHSPTPACSTRTRPPSTGATAHDAAGVTEIERGGHGDGQPRLRRQRHVHHHVRVQETPAPPATDGDSKRGQRRPHGHGSDLTVTATRRRSPSTPARSAIPASPAPPRGPRKHSPPRSTGATAAPSTPAYRGQRRSRAC